MRIKMHKCTKCDILFPRNKNHFYTSNSNLDGMQGHCRKCQNSIKKKFVERSDDKYKQRDGYMDWSGTGDAGLYV